VGVDPPSLWMEGIPRFGGSGAPVIPGPGPSQATDTRLLIARYGQCRIRRLLTR